MRRVILILLILVLVGVMASAQNQLKPLVLFVVDKQIGSASPFDVGAEGVTALARIFTNFGADVLPVTINQPLPDTVKVD